MSSFQTYSISIGTVSDTDDLRGILDESRQDHKEALISGLYPELFSDEELKAIAVKWEISDERW